MNRRCQGGWLQWGVIWRFGLVVFIGVSFCYAVVRSIWDFTGSFEGQLRSKGYGTEVVVEKGSAKTLGNRAQQLYIARVQAGTCLLRLERTQWDGDFRLVEVNGRAINYNRESPTKDETLAHLKEQGIVCETAK